MFMPQFPHLLREVITPPSQSRCNEDTELTMALGQQEVPHTGKSLLLSPKSHQIGLSNLSPMCSLSDPALVPVSGFFSSLGQHSRRLQPLNPKTIPGLLS